MTITNWRQFNYNRYSKFLRNWNWEWMATLTFPFERIGRNIVKHRLVWWSRDLCNSEHMQIGYYYVICWKYGHPHLHLLMLGRGTRNGEQITLLDVDCKKWERRWPHLAKIEWAGSSSAVAKYLARHMFYSQCDGANLDSYNSKLLQREISTSAPDR